jgi:hypothetical protein
MLTTLSPEDLIAGDHPIRRIRGVVDAVLATVLMAPYSIRSELAFCERLNYDLLFKWFLDLPIDARAFDATTFSKNRERLLAHEIADRFFAAVVTQAKLRRYVSSEHFSVDGTLLEAWASTWSPSSPRCATSGSPPTSRPTPPASAAPSTGAPPATPATA